MTRKILLGAVIIAIAGAIYYLDGMKLKPSKTTDSQIRTSANKDFPRARELVNVSGFINTDKITVSELIGKKVVLVDFWTYSCINCQRTQPYLNAWYEKYREAGLEIIGVHTPEFEFEKKYDNVKAAVQKAGIKYPVALDNDYATWQAYGNRYWPRKYLIDIDGFIVYDHIGEGAYEETERKIKQLLEERLKALGQEGTITEDLSNPVATSADRSVPLSPEIYFGTNRLTALAKPQQTFIRSETNYQLPQSLEPNTFALEGEWKFYPEYAILAEGSEGTGKIRLRFTAAKVFMVAGAASPLNLEITVDGKKQPAVYVSDKKLYTIFGSESGGEHILEIFVPSQANFEAYTFTFG